MYFWFFKLKKWGKKKAETRRRNCAVLSLHRLIFMRCGAMIRKKEASLWIF